MNRTENIKELNLKNLMIRHIKSNNSSLFIKTNFSSIDKIIDGFYSGEVIIIGGRPGMGKTAFSLSLMKNICIDTDYKVPSFFITLELSKEQLFRKLMETYNQNNNDKAPFSYDLQTVDNIKSSPMYILEVTGNNIEVIIEKCKKLINEKGIKVIIIDYIQLINSLSKEDNRDVEITKIMTKLKQLAVNTGVVVIILSQLSKAVDARMSMGGEGPMLCDFRESESFFNIPDKVLCNRSRKY